MLNILASSSIVERFDFSTVQCLFFLRLQPFTRSNLLKQRLPNEILWGRYSVILGSRKILSSL